MFRAAVLALVSAVVVPACSSSSSGGTGGHPTTCSAGPMAYDGGGIDYSRNTMSAHACGSPSMVVSGTASAGAACARGADCSPACCVCPTGTAGAGQQVLLGACDNLKCAPASEVCCLGYLYSVCNAGGGASAPVDASGG
jgi:hypothetical protein